MRWLLVLLAACSSADKPATVPNVEQPTGNAISVAATHEVASEEVTFTVGKRQVGGTIAAPKTPGRWPAILLLAGSGPTDRDWNSALIPTKNGSGALLATELAKHGAVVLRFDKAGSGKNPGPPVAEWTIDTYRDEATAALALLRARADVRGDRVFVAGHSEGGIHATRLAQVAQVSGIIYLASASRTMVDTILAQLEAQLKNPMAMLSDKAVDQEMSGLRVAFADFMMGKPVDPQKASRIPQLQQLVTGLINPATATLTRALLGFDNAVEAPKLAGPFYVSAGGKDVQIDLERDAKRLDKALRDAGRDVTFHRSPDADHVLKHEKQTLEQIRANPQAAQNAYNAEGRVLDEDFVSALVEWLAARSR